MADKNWWLSISNDWNFFRRYFFELKPWKTIRSRERKVLSKIALFNEVYWVEIPIYGFFFVNS